MKFLENKIQHVFAKSHFMTWLAVKIRNQLNAVIAYHLCESDHSDLNGEFKLIDHLAHHIHFFVDVGANVGDWSGHLLERTSANGVCIEPSSQCALQLKKLFNQSNIKILELALSNWDGKTQFLEESNCGETSSLDINSKKINAVLRTVKVSTLDLQIENQNIDFLKIDCEGWDLKVLEGGLQCLKRTKFIQFEYNSYWLNAGSSLIQALNFLGQLDFEVYLLKKTGLHPFRYNFWTDYFRYSNFFACRNCDKYLIQGLIRDPI